MTLQQYVHFVFLATGRKSADGYLMNDKSEERKRAYSPTYTQTEQLRLKVR